jgi:acyl-CoA synthetase (NDP forming)
MNSMQRKPYEHHELERLINPKSIAIIGASSRLRSFGNQTVVNLQRFQGRVYPINPKAGEIEGRTCCPNLAALPEVPDCAILAVPREQVIGLVEECGQRGIGGVIVYASGFAETSNPDNAALQDQLASLAARYNIRILGPNCVGLVNVGSGGGFHFMTEFERMELRQGHVAIISQSGALAFALLQAMHDGVGFSYAMATGNACDVDIADYINYLAEDQNTKAVACVLEGVRDAKRFIAAGQRLRASGKTLVVYKTGRGRTGGDVAKSHTGAIVGSNEAFDAALDHIAAVSVDDLQELLGAANFFAKVRGPATAPGVGIMATSGGAAVILADKADAHGVRLPSLQQKTIDRLTKVVPDFGRVGNPTDTTAQVLATPEHFQTCIEAFLEDERISALIVPMIFLSQGVTQQRMRVLGDIARRYDKPIAVIWMSSWLSGPGAPECEADDRLIAFHAPDYCFRTLLHWIRLSSATSQNAEVEPVADLAAPHRLLAATDDLVLTERESKNVVAACGVPVTKERLAKDAATAVEAAQTIGYPVALKIESPDIPHKSDAGVVRLNVGSDDVLRAACDELAAAARRHAPGADLRGFLVQEMIPAGLELMVGTSRDPQFGPLVTVGFGGVLIELLTDTTTRLAPVDHAAALRMLRSLRGARLLDGFRGAPAVDIDRLANVVVHISELAARTDDIDQIDINPLIASGGSVVAVDALIVRTGPTHPVSATTEMVGHIVNEPVSTS